MIQKIISIWQQKKTKRNIIILASVSVILYLVIVVAVKSLHPANPDDIPVAEVGDRVITLRDFRMNYEFGFPSLKVGKELFERRRSYLNAMVNEMLLANEGYRLGLDKHQRVEDNDRDMVTDLLTDALIQNEIVEKTTVSDNEIRDAINKSKVQIKIRYWGEPTKEGAEAARASMLSRGYAKALDSILSVHKDVPLIPSMLESDYLNAFEVDPTVINALKDIQLGGISQPVQVKDGFYVFQLVDIRRKGIMEHEYVSQYSTMKKVLLNLKYDEGITKFVGEYMTPQHVVTKGEAFWKLSEAMAEWIEKKDFERMSLRDAVKNASIDQKRYAELQAMWDQPMVTYAQGRYTVGEFLDIFKPSLRDMNPSNMELLRKLTNQQVALTIRNQLLAKEAQRRGLDKLPSVKHERQIWRDKSVYEEMRQMYVGDLRLEKNSAKTIKEILTRKADSLRTRYHVSINYKIIDTLNIPESNASRWMGMQLFKSGSKKIAIPMTDGLWGKL